MQNIQTKFIAIAVLIITIVIISGLVLFKIHTDGNEIKRLTSENSKLEFSVSEQKKVIEQQLNDINSKDKINTEFKNLIQELNSEKRELRDKFNKEKLITKTIDNKEIKIKKQRDIGELAIKKPKLIQNAVNKGTLDVFECFKNITNPDSIGECK